MGPMAAGRSTIINSPAKGLPQTSGLVTWLKGGWEYSWRILTHLHSGDSGMYPYDTLNNVYLWVIIPNCPLIHLQKMLGSTILCFPFGKLLFFLRGGGRCFSGDLVRSLYRSDAQKTSNYSCYPKSQDKSFSCHFNWVKGKEPRAEIHGTNSITANSYPYRSEGDMAEQPYATCSQKLFHVECGKAN